jgi:N-acetylglucosamine kinase-like BadF-type ATPase
MKHKLYMGVDGGASKTDVILAQDGKILKVVRGGPSNPQGPMGLEGAMDQLAQAISEATQGYDRHNLYPAVLGLAGADFPEDVEMISEQLNKRVPWLRYSIVNDTEIALLGGSRQGYGIVAICGTATNVLGIHPDGRRCQIGGLGYEFGDFGGGADLAREVLHVAFCSYERRGPKTSLEAGVLERMNQKDYETLKRGMYFHTIHPLAFLALVPLCFEKALEGDDVAAGLLKRMAQSLAETVIATAKQLRWEEGTFEVILAGSLWEGASPVLHDHFRHLLHQVYPLCDIHLPELSPGMGAILKAVQNDSQSVALWRQQLREQKDLA